MSSLKTIWKTYDFTNERCIIENEHASNRRIWVYSKIVGMHLVSLNRTCANENYHLNLLRIDKARAPIICNLKCRVQPGPSDWWIHFMEQKFSHVASSVSQTILWRSEIINEKIFYIAPHGPKHDAENSKWETIYNDIRIQLNYQIYKNKTPNLQKGGPGQELNPQSLQCGILYNHLQTWPTRLCVWLPGQSWACLVINYFYYLVLMDVVIWLYEQLGLVAKVTP